MPIDRSPPRSMNTGNAEGSTQNEPGQSQPGAGAQISNPGARNEQYENQHVAAVSRQIKLPPFCRQNPRLWFAQVEMAFLTNGITTDISQFRFVAVHLSGEVLDTVSDIILTPPNEGKFAALKQRIIAAFDEGDERRLRRLLRSSEMSDERPTAYLHRLKNLAGGQCSDPVLRSLLLEQLPEQIRAILASTDTQDPSRLAEMADRAMDAFKPSIAAVNTVAIPGTMQPSNVDSQGKPCNLQTAINSLQLQVEALTKRLDRELRTRRSRSSSRGRGPRGRSSSASNKGRNSSRPCYFHRRFGAEARNCQEPCGWPKAQPTPEGNQ